MFDNLKSIHNVCHHQPINVPTDEAQAFLMDYTRGTGQTHQEGPVRGGYERLQMQPSAYCAFLHSEAHGRARDNKLLVTHLMTFAKYE
jgi:hypothetical protein